ncbi:MAG: sugar ABC transporter permease [Defluviitaleaceae bacterium]|nr:sugar ABC transporter permease [Defluviitaleaceae bacterium]
MFESSAKTKRKPMSAARKREIFKNWVPMYVMLLPFLILYFLFMFLPIMGGAVLSLTDFNGLQFPAFVGTGNFSRLFLRDPVFLIALRNTLFLALITGPSGVIISFLVAWLIRELHRPLRLVFATLMYLPALTGAATFATVMRFIFAADSHGLINSFLMRTNILIDPINWVGDANWTMTTVVIVSLWTSFGIGFLAFMAGLAKLDKAYYEAAAIDGMRNRMQELYYVTLPQMGPQLLFGAVMSIAGAFTVGLISEQMTGNPSVAYSTHTLMLHMQEVGTQRFEMGYAAAVSIVMFVMMQITWSLIKRMLKRFNAGN